MIWTYGIVEPGLNWQELKVNPPGKIRPSVYPVKIDRTKMDGWMDGWIQPVKIAITPRSEVHGMNLKWMELDEWDSGMNLKGWMKFRGWVEWVNLKGMKFMSEWVRFIDYLKMGMKFMNEWVSEWVSEWVRFIEWSEWSSWIILKWGLRYGRVRPPFTHASRLQVTSWFFKPRILYLSVPHSLTLIYLTFVTWLAPRVQFNEFNPVWRLKLTHGVNGVNWTGYLLTTGLTVSTGFNLTVGVTNKFYNLVTS